MPTAATSADRERLVRIAMHASLALLHEELCRVGKGATRESACAMPTRTAFGTRGHGVARHSRARAHSASKTRVNALTAHSTNRS
jgi:hypothetical protein